jgi:hypothetical protein
LASHLAGVRFPGCSKTGKSASPAAFYRNLRSSRGLLRRENHERHEDEGVPKNEAGELNNIILLFYPQSQDKE